MTKQEPQMMICPKAKECKVDNCDAKSSHDICCYHACSYYACIPVEPEPHLCDSCTFCRDSENGSACEFEPLSTSESEKRGVVFSGHDVIKCPSYSPADLKPAEPHIKCLFFKNGKCIKPLDPTAECKNCGKPAGTCALTCDCEEETCNIGSIAEPAEMPLISDAVQEKLYCKWIDQDDDKYHNAIAKAQRDADMAWHNEKVQQVRQAAVKEFAEKVAKQIEAEAHPPLSEWGNGYQTALMDVTNGIRAMAEGGR